MDLQVAAIRSESYIRKALVEDGGLHGKIGKAEFDSGVKVGKKWKTGVRVRSLGEKLKVEVGVGSLHQIKHCDSVSLVNRCSEGEAL